MKRTQCARAGCLFLGLAMTVSAETVPASLWSAGPIDFSGLVDGYYSLNFNHPASRTNQLRNFDVKANQFSLNMAKLTLEHAADPVGFRVDLGFGRAFDMVHSGEKDRGVINNFEQVFVSLKPPKARGLQVDFGKFVTAAGAEVIETNSNWNYSRSLLFAWAIPYYHFGLRASYPLHKHFNAGIHLVNGWNNVEDNNSGKTVGLIGSFTSSKVTWTHTYHVGPEKTDTNQGYRHLYDTTLLLTPSAKANFYLNVDYGVDKQITGRNFSWKGVAGAARLAPTEWFALSPRLEWFSDTDGFSTGTAQKLKEFTLTAEFKMKDGILMRPEYRCDWSDTPFFDRGSASGTHKSQTTLLVGLVAFFGPKR
ncbi:MAG: porin [Acidobacteria bacterium]|nr:porin [Acidobacteriota bacterium]